MEPTITHIFQSASEDTDTINNLFFWFFIAAGAVFSAVVLSIIYITRRFSAKRKTIQTTHYHSERKTEIVLTSLATLMVFVFLFFTIKIMWKVQSPPAVGQQPDIIITGHQWWWEVYYPASGVTAANEVHLPAGKRLWVQLESADVIHDWWVPALGRKMDMVPGHSNYVWVQARQAGVYEGMCSEFCGAQHAWMRVQVIAHEPDDFIKWQENQTRVMSMPKDSLLLRGAQLFKEKTCANCHTVKGWATQATIGPDLTHIGSRVKILGGKELNNLEHLKSWIANPQKMKPGAHMPNFLMTPDEVNAIATWLYALK